jgi:NAD(P)-dependent dehydrogenase (short-subunit alcohol dehydrogenase family)
MSQSCFQGARALVTGGNSGIGLATARALASAGARVVVHGRDAATLAAAVRELGDGSRGVRGDLADPEDVERLMEAVRETLGGLDVVFANAGIAEFRPFAEVDLDLLQRTFDVNFRGTFLTLQKALPLLAENAAIVVNTSIVGSIGMAGASVYGPSKAALRNLVRVLAAELAPRGVRVNAIAPGPIETPIYGRMGLDAAATEALAGQIQAQVPLGRFGAADDVAQAVLALAANPFITGAELPVDGGMAQV